MTNALPLQTFIETFLLSQCGFCAYFDQIFQTPGEENLLRTTTQTPHITDCCCLITNIDYEHMLKHEDFQNS